MKAILSDIHGNLEALTAVLADLERQGIKDICNLGDTLGYGPNPIECLDLAMRMSVVLLGNFDHAVLCTPEGYCIAAERSVLWTQDQLDTVGEPAEKQRRKAFLDELPRSFREGPPSARVLYVHGSARNPLNEYLFPEDIYNPRKIERIGALIERLCFCGHTHLPGFFREDSSGKWEYLHPEEGEGGFLVAGAKVICNVGSVGQPRDGDERACYALFDGERIWFRRVAYDIETTVRKIHEREDLDDFLGNRLRDGR